jgi:branched-chain amino acid transport system permease protein
MAQALVVGLISGGIYGLFALGLVLVYKGSGALNFAQAQIGTFTIFVAQSIVVGHGKPYLVGAVCAVATAVAMGLTFERVAVWPLRARSRLTVTIATLALLSLLIALVLVIFGPLPRQLPPPIHGAGTRIAGVLVQPSQMLSLVFVLAIAVTLAAFLRYTDFGLAVVAAAQDQEAVRFSGIRLARISMFTWGTAAALSAIAALLVEPTIALISPIVYGVLFIKALGAALIGGLESMPGAFVGGIVVGVGEATIRHATISSNLAGLPELCIFGAILVTLLFRPQGLLGES